MRAGAGSEMGRADSDPVSCIGRIDSDAAVGAENGAAGRKSGPRREYTVMATAHQCGSDPLLVCKLLVHLLLLRMRWERNDGVGRGQKFEGGRGLDGYHIKLDCEPVDASPV